MGTQNTPTTTADEQNELAQPWKISVARWQHLKGVHQPWIAEVSPAQLGMMSKRQRDAYGKKRDAEWAASGQCKNEYRDAVVAAFDAGLFKPTDAAVSDDARKQVYYATKDREEAAAKDKLRAAMQENRPGIEDLQVGDRVFSVMGSFYGTITKKSQKSVRIKPEKPSPGLHGHDFKADIGAVQWLHYNELEAALKTGQPVRPVRPVQEPWSIRHAREEKEAMARRYRCRGCKQDGQGQGFYTTHFAECLTPGPTGLPEMDVLA